MAEDGVRKSPETEVERAASKRKPIIAFRVDLAPLSAALEYFLSQSQWIEVPALGMKAALAKLADAVGQGSVMASHSVTSRDNAGSKKPIVIAATVRHLRIGCLAVICVALGTCAKPSVAEDAATTLFYDAHVFTAEYDHPYAEAVAIRGERIIAVGTLGTVEQIAGPNARRVDLHGQFLMPGIIDAHAHPIMGGIALTQASFSQSGAVEALVQFVAEQMKRRESMRGDVLVINDIDTSYWAQAAAIDASLSKGAFAKQAIVLEGSDGHTAWANSTARARAGITERFIRGLKPGDRQYYGIDSTRHPNGFVVDAGKNKLDSSLPPFSAEFMLKAGRAAVHYLNGFGITAWLDAMASGSVGGSVPATVNDPGYLPVYRELGARGELTAHVAAYAVVQPDLGPPQIEVVEALRARFKDVPNLTIPGLKVFADGVAEFPSQTAALTKPYSNTGRSAPLLFTPAKMNALVTEAARRGLTVHIHAIGDLAVKASLDAFEAARKAVPDSTLPFALTHAQFVDPEDIARFAQLHVIAVLQLLWAQQDASSVEQVKPYVDAEIYRWMYPARSILDAGGEIAGASDWPVSTPNPFLAMYVAETRSGETGGVLDPAQRMPREAMLYAYTRNAAKVLNQLDEIGTLSVGKRADLALIDRDLLAVPAAELAKAAVVWTMFGGKIVFGQAP
jgi:predicted amidohydrolase YtcJ